MTTVHARSYVERAALKDGEPIPFVAATEGLKADGIDLRMDRVLLDRFHNNPVIGYGHDYWGRDSLPIGRSVETSVDGPRLRMAVEFDGGDPFATDVDRKIRSGYLNAMSIGFDIGRVDADGVPDWWELYESSVVPIPLDPDATAERIARMLAGVRQTDALNPPDASSITDAIEALQALLPDSDVDRTAPVPPPADAAAVAEQVRAMLTEGRISAAELHTLADAAAAPALDARRRRLQTARAR